MNFPAIRAGLLFVFLALFASLATVSGEEPLTVHISVPDGPAAPGEAVGLRIQITNRTSDPATEVAFSLDLPDGLTIANPPITGVVCEDSSITAHPGTTAFEFTDGRIEAEQTCSFLLNVVAGPTGEYRILTGEATSSAGDACPVATVLSVKTSDVLLGAALDASVDGTRLTFDLRLRNLDGGEIAELSAHHDLDAALGFENYRLVSPPALVGGPDSLSPNPNFNGSSDTQLILQSTENERAGETPRLAANGTARIRYVVEVVDVTDTGSGVGSFSTQASVSGRATAGVTTDLSDEGPFANAGGPGNDDPTTFSIGISPAIAAAHSIRFLSQVDPPHVQLIYAVENLGEADVTDVNVTHDLNAVFGAGNFSFSGPSRTEIVQNGARMALNNSFDGSSNTSLFQPGGALAPDERVVVTMEIRINTVTDQGFGLGVYQSQFSASATSITGPSLSDISDAGFVLDPNGNGVGDEPGENDPLVFAVASKLGVATDVTITGTSATLDYYLEVFGPVDIGQLSLRENLDLIFGAGNYALGEVILVDDPGTILLNGNFDGIEDTELIGPTSTLAGGDTAQIRVAVALARIVNQGNGLGVYRSSAIASGSQSGDIFVTDLTTPGTDPDPNGNGNPNEIAENSGAPFTAPIDAIVGGAHTASVAGNRVTLDLVIRNTRTATANQVGIDFDLDEILGVGNYTITSPPSFLDDPGTLTLNGAFDGSSDTSILIPGGTLVSAATARIRIEVDVTTISDPLEKGLGVYESQFETTSADSVGLIATDLSTTGTEPDPNFNGDPTEEPAENVPTAFLIGESAIGFSLRSDVDGTAVTYTYTLQNLGDVPVSDIFLRNPLNPVFGSGNYSIIQQPTLIEGPSTLLLSPQFFGFNIFDRVVLGGSIAAGETIRFTTRIAVNTVSDQGLGFGIYENRLTVEGQNLDGVVSDLSDDGLFPDGNGNGAADDPDESDFTRTIIGDEARIGLAESVSTSGRRVDLDLHLENLGGSALSNLMLEKNLDDVFGAGNWSLTRSPIFLDDPGTLPVNLTYDGSANSQLFDGVGHLGVLDTATVRLEIEVTNATDRGLGLGNYQSQSEVTADAPLGSLAFDVSDAGTDPDPNGNGIAFEGAENDPAFFSVFTSNVGVALAAAIEGRTVTFDYTLSNLGDVSLSNLTLPHDLDAVFGAGNYTVTRTPFFPGVFRELELNDSFDGSADPELIGGGALGPGVTERFRVVVRVDTVTDQGSGQGTYTTQVTATATGSLGVVMDSSDDGDQTDPDGDGAGDGDGENDLTAFSLNGSIGDLVWNDRNANGTFDRGERGLGGITVFLDEDENGILGTGEPSATTGADGSYTIANLPAGNYTIQIDPMSIPAGFTLTAGELPSFASLTAGEILDTTDFGLHNPNEPSVEPTLGRPDLRIGTRRNPNSHRFNNVYRGRQELRTRSTRPVSRFYFSLENDGNVLDRIRTTASGLSRQFRISIRDHRGAGNVTAALRRNGYTRSLQEGQRSIFSVRLTMSRLIRSATFRSRIVSTSSTTPNARDQVRSTIRFRSTGNSRPTSLFLPF